MAQPTVISRYLYSSSCGFAIRDAVIVAERNTIPIAMNSIIRLLISKKIRAMESNIRITGRVWRFAGSMFIPINIASTSIGKR